MTARTVLLAATVAGAALGWSVPAALAQEPAEPQQPTAAARAPAPQDRAVPRESPRETPRNVERGGDRSDRGGDDRGSRGVQRAPEPARAEAPAPAPTPQSDDRASRRWPTWRDGSDDTRGTPRPESTSPNDRSSGRTAVEGQSAAPAPNTAPDDQRRAVPRGQSRPRGDRPEVGRAVPRTGPPPRDARGGRYDGRYDRGGRGGVYVSPRYYSYYYYPRRYYPYGYGGFGLGFYYYDPYAWYGYDPYYGRPYYSGGYYGRRYDEGDLRLDVRPRSAEVYVDGYYAGVVDDFDGVFQSLRLEDGPHRIEIVAPGFETLDFDVRIEPGRKTTYRGDMRPYRP